MDPQTDRIQLHTGDITTLDVDAIVNAANPLLRPGGGVCGAIFQAAGRELEAACREAGPCPTGEARLTPGFNLPARYVIHAVGPIWRGGDAGEPEALARCYRNILSLCEAHRLTSVAIPAISCGIYGYPMDKAARLAVDTVAEGLAGQTFPRTVIFCLYDAAARAHYERALEAVAHLNRAP
ncbi:MAG: macro domain-containing protein [Gammaproteobacteria bacterium]|nr:MAG: macro domain-containing protein [Gammaproteobacteria bacterium]